METADNKIRKPRQPLTAKRWTLFFVGTITFVMLMIAIVNYIVDPFSYFHAPVTEDRGAYSYDGSYNFRLTNYRYFKQSHQEYSGVILGGSKGMFLEQSYLSAVSGEKYCNLSAHRGSLHDYLDWVRWIADNTDIRNIFLNLSSSEVIWYSPKDRDEEGTGWIEPASLDRDKSVIIEFIQYLYRGGIKPSLQYLKAKKDNRLDWYDFDKHTITAIISPLRASNPWADYERWMPALDSYLEKSDNGIYVSMPAIEQNLTALREIREICEESDIQLSVVIAPTSIIQYLEYESPEYWDYLREMNKIVNYWDFSLPNAINKNRFNFINSGHMYSEALRHMINQIYGIEPDDGSGVYVTTDNIEEYIAERQRRYEELMEEYAETGTIEQGMYLDDSYVMNELFDPVITNTQNEWVTNIPLIDCLNITQRFYASFDHLEGIGIFAESVPKELENLGNLKLRVYDDTGRHTIYSGDVDLTEIRNNRVHFIRFNGLELTEGHWYSLIFSYEPRNEDDFFSFQCVNGEPTGDMYMELDGIPQGHEMKMHIFRSQTYGNYRQKDAVLQTDRMRGEGEGETREITEQTRYTQFFTADCDLLSYIQLKTSHRNDPEEPEAADEEYSIILELRDSGGTLMSSKTIMGAVLQNADVYNVTFDGDLYMETGEAYELTIYANKTTEHGLRLLTHGEETGSALFLNDARTGESLCYRIYGVNED